MYKRFIWIIATMFLLVAGFMNLKINVEAVYEPEIPWEELVDEKTPTFPKGKGIVIGSNSWNTLQQKIVYDKIYTTTTTVTISATDDLSGIREYAYYLDKSGSTKVLTAKELDACTFVKDTDGKFNLTKDGKYVIYAVAVDKAGNQSDYICSGGLIVDTKKYTITYQLNGGTQNAKNPNTYLRSQTDITLQTPTRDGYSFCGWYQDAKFTKVITKIPATNPQNLTLYAKWELLPTVPDKPHKIANVVSGVHVYWKAIDGISKYGLWRSETGKNGTYKWLCNPTTAHYTDTKVESGKTYYYKVSYMNYAGTHSEKSEALGITYVSTPDISSRANKAAGIQLGWKKVTGATGYAIYRKSYNGNDAWTRVGMVEGNSTFTWMDTTVKGKNGTIYRYTIRALAGSDRKTLSGCRNTGRTMVRLDSRVLNSATKASATAIKCDWTTSSAVNGYEVRFMVGSKVYKTFVIGNYKTGVKTFTGLQAGKTYKVQVRSCKKVEGVGIFYSAWSVARNVKM